MRLSIVITVSMNGALKLQAGLGDDADRLAEPHHQRLLGLAHGEQRAVADHDRDDQQHDQRDNACNAGLSSAASALLLRLAGAGAPDAAASVRSAADTARRPASRRRRCR